MKHKNEPETKEISCPLLRERYFKTVHPSGLSVYVFPKPLTTAVACFAVRYGSSDNAFISPETGDEIRVPAGVAHFLEHKLFENEDGSDAFENFAALGADANAYTTYGRTVYLFSCTERAGEALAELLHFVTHPHFTEASVKRERGIIAEEIREYDDSPWERCYHELLGALYHSHPIKENICGTLSSIEKITPEWLYRCHKAFYTPSNMALVVCGDIDAAAVYDIVDRAGLPTQADALPRPLPTHEPDTVAHASVRRRMQVAKPLFCIGFKDPSVPRDATARLRHELCMSLLCEILFSRSGVFYNALFEEGLLTPAFSCGYSAGEDFGFVCLSGESDDPDEVLRRCKSYLEKVRENGIDAEDFERCRRTLYADELRAYDSADEIAGRLLAFALDGTEMFSCPTVLQSVTSAELVPLLENLCDGQRISLSVIEPNMEI